MPRLPLVPPLLPDEALSSWIARIAARYDLTGESLVRHLLPGDSEAGPMARTIDYGAAPSLEAALGAAAGLSPSGFAVQRQLGTAASPHAAWPRQRAAWCPLCVAQDLAVLGETYVRREWACGGYLICVRHRCLLVSECPRCFQHVGYHPVQGRRRLWCGPCDIGIETALKPQHVPFWPFGTPQQQGTCQTVSLSCDAVPLLLQVQADVMATLAAGARPGSAHGREGTAIGGPRRPSPWVRGLKRHRFLEVLRTLSFVVLGPLWADAHRVAVEISDGGATWKLPDCWTPGSLPPAVAAPALLASAAFLAAENNVMLSGIAWNPALLQVGEGRDISTETLLWHLDVDDAALVCRLFTTPLTRPFLMLLQAIRADPRGLCAARESARRRTGVRGAYRDARRQEEERLWESEAAQAERQRRNPPDRFKLSRVLAAAAPGRRPHSTPAQQAATLAVYIAIGADRADDLLAPWPACDGTLLQNRYVRQWLARHRHLDAARLIGALTEAVTISRAENRGIGSLRDPILPELLVAATPSLATPW